MKAVARRHLEVGSDCSGEIDAYACGPTPMIDARVA